MGHEGSGAGTAVATRAAASKHWTARPRLGTVTILLPTKNEESGIAETILALPRTQLEDAGWDVDVLVVDGNSRDRTRDIAASLGARVVHLHGQGKGRDFRESLASIQSDVVVMLDADNTYPADAIPDFVEATAPPHAADVVMGTRLRGKIQDGAMSRTNLLGNKILSGLATLLYAKRCTDVCTGMWAFKTSALKQLMLNSERFEIEAELFAQSAKARLRIQEIPIVYTRRAGKSGLKWYRDGVSIAAKLVRKRVVG